MSKTRHSKGTNTSKDDNEHHGLVRIENQILKEVNEGTFMCFTLSL